VRKNVMPTSHHSFDERAPFEADRPRIPKTPEDVIDRVGTRLAMLVLCVACLIAALWVLSTPSFEKCTVLTSASERYVCYEALREVLSRPPTR
jgi:hypothetical protein